MLPKHSLNRSKKVMLPMAPPKGGKKGKIQMEGSRTSSDKIERTREGALGPGAKASWTFMPCHLGPLLSSRKRGGGRRGKSDEREVKKRSPAQQSAPAPQEFVRHGSIRERVCSTPGPSLAEIQLSPSRSIGLPRHFFPPSPGTDSVTVARFFLVAFSFCVAPRPAPPLRGLSDP